MRRKIRLFILFFQRTPADRAKLRELREIDKKLDAIDGKQ